MFTNGADYQLARRKGVIKQRQKKSGGIHTRHTKEAQLCTIGGHEMNDYSRTGGIQEELYL